MLILGCFFLVRSYGLPIFNEEIKKHPTAMDKKEKAFNGNGKIASAPNGGAEPQTISLLPAIVQKSIEKRKADADRIIALASKLEQMRNTSEKVHKMLNNLEEGNETLSISAGGESLRTSNPRLIKIVLEQFRTFADSELPKIEAEIMQAPGI